MASQRLGGLEGRQVGRPRTALAYRFLENGHSDGSIFGHVGYGVYGNLVAFQFAASVPNLIVVLLDDMYWPLASVDLT
jgi:hypothetical protein